MELTPVQVTQLEQLKMLIEETDSNAIVPPCDMCSDCGGAQPISMRQYSDEDLAQWLDYFGWQVKATAYELLLRKADNTELTLGSGIKLPDNSAYWLRLAKRFRPIGSRNLKRADDLPPRGRS